MEDATAQTNRCVKIAPSQTAFTTNRVQFAAFLMAGKHLQYVGSKRSRHSGVVSFVFEDSRCQGATLEHQFETGASAPARDLFAAHRWLLNQIDRTLAQEIG
jgi:hypothetical protein